MTTPADQIATLAARLAALPDLISKAARSASTGELDSLLIEQRRAEVMLPVITRQHANEQRIARRAPAIAARKVRLDAITSEGKAAADRVKAAPATAAAIKDAFALLARHGLAKAPSTEYLDQEAAKRVAADRQRASLTAEEIEDELAAIAFREARQLARAAVGEAEMYSKHINTQLSRLNITADMDDLTILEVLPISLLSRVQRDRCAYLILAENWTLLERLDQAEAA